MNFNFRTAVLCLSISLFAVSIADADIVSLMGDVEMIAPPPIVQEGVLESASLARLFQERQEFVLPSALSVDITTTGVFDEVVELTPGSISAGTLVNSYFLHADAAGAVLFEGTIVFEQEILGVIITENNLQASHPVIGSPLTTYPVDASQDAMLAPLTLDAGLDSVTVILPDTLVFHLDRTFQNQTYDHVRVITAAIPEPSSGIMLAMGVLAVALRRSRRKRA